MSLDWQHRITAEDVLEHPWFHECTQRIESTNLFLVGGGCFGRDDALGLRVSVVLWWSFRKPVVRMPCKRHARVNGDRPRSILKQHRMGLAVDSTKQRVSFTHVECL